MNPQKDTLSEALRELAGASPEVPAELGSRLSSEFARHHVWRKRKRAGVVLGLAACLAISVYWLRPRSERTAVKVVTPSAQSAQVATGSPQVVASESPKVSAPSLASAGAKLKARPNRSRSVRAAESKQAGTPDAEQPLATIATGDFVALPTFDPAIPVGESRMVRVDMPGSALQLIGYPVDGRLLDRRILTDVLVGQDGMPYAVRLVNTRNTR